MNDLGHSHLTVRAPWARGVIRELGDYQNSGRFHPYTCPNDHPMLELTPTKEGWVCVLCGYTQDWAHTWTVNGSWRRSAEPSM
jgi:hypothetical protein